MTALSVIIPAYNEVMRLPDTIRETANYLSRLPYKAEIIVVDDGSQDGTAGTVEAMKARLPVDLTTLSYAQNRGKGYAVKAGVQAARGERVLFMDADMSVPISDLGNLAACLDAGADIAIGSKMQDHSRTQLAQSKGRRAAGRLFNAFVRFATGLRFHDTQCGFKLFTNEAALALFSRAKAEGFAFDVEILLLAQRMNFQTMEVPIHLIDRPHSSVKVVTHGLQMIWEVFRIRARLMRRRADFFARTDGRRRPKKVSSAD